MTVPTLLVLSLADSFAEAWPALAREAGLVLDFGTDPAEAARAAVARPPSAVVVAAGGVEHRAADAVRRLRAEGALATPPIVVGSLDDRRGATALAVALAAAGAADYLALPADLPELRRWLAAARATPPDTPDPDFAALVGRSAALRAAVARARRIAPLGTATVLVTGETGTGKQLLAEGIHRASPRGAGPFVQVNCAALPPALLEAELFGYERGAFTDARAAKPGLLETAEGGTLFLDEIGELPLELQAKLLVALEHRRVRRLGGVRERTVDARIVAATHVELAAAVDCGRFRADLRYRLDVLAVRLPALRERAGDAPLLAEHFARAIAARHGLVAPAVDDADRRALEAWAWPGNVRELRNVVERALLCGEPLRAQLTAPAHERTGALRSSGEPGSLRALERGAAREMVARCGGNKTRAARLLGVSRKRLYALLRADGGRPTANAER